MPPGNELVAEAMARVESRAAFDAASRGRLLRDLAAILTGHGRTLLPLAEVTRAAHADSQVHRGLREIPIASIRGSENRTRDFDATFHPLGRHLRERWARLYAHVEQGHEVPPIDVYQVGGVYFVKDGHHRVSVARRLGWETIRACVTEVRTRAPLPSDLGEERLLRVAEYASFLETTQLDRTRPEARLECSSLGRYDVILDHIQGHRYFLAAARDQEVSLAEAASSWYDTVYRPVMRVIERHDLAKQLPDLTETDLYLEVTRLWLDLEEHGCPAGPEPAVEALLAEHPPTTVGRRVLRRAGLGPRARRLAPANVLGTLRRRRPARFRRR